MKLDISPMLNAYPDSMGGTLHDNCATAGPAGI